MSCGVGRRCSLDPTLLWLRCRLEATAPNGPLAWEPPYAVSVALKDKKQTNKGPHPTTLKLSPPCATELGIPPLGNHSYEFKVK